MDPRMVGVFSLGAITTVAGCSGDKNDSDSGYIGTPPGTSAGYMGTPTVTGTSTTGTMPGTTPPRMELAVAWGSVTGTQPTTGVFPCGDTANITVVDADGQGPYTFGLVDSGTGGWTGEDCIGPSLCHPIDANHVLTQTADCDPASAVAGSTTGFGADAEPNLTYLLNDGSTGECFVTGADPAYYAALGCDTL